MSHIYLIGFMGAGKSTVGTLVAKRLSRPFIDMDEEIEATAGMSVAELFSRFGEEEFRIVESEVLASIAGENPAVVACGGGVVIRDDNRTLLKESGVVVYLRVSAAEALARIGDTATRPLLSGTAGHVAATSLLDARKALYSAVSDIEVDTSGRSPREVADAVVARIAAKETG